jgi:threonine/homoserine/homoserine lactone efflux protein
VLDYLLFASAFLASAIPPGADTFLILSRAIESKRQAWIAAAGITTGKVLMVSAAFFGLANLIRDNAELLTVLKFLGAGFLVFRAVQLWNATRSTKPSRGGSEYFAALAIGFSNPQPFAFYLSIIPAVVTQTFLPGLLAIVVIGFGLVSALYILLAGQLSNWLGQIANYQKVNRSLAIVFLVLAVIVVSR